MSTPTLSQVPAGAAAPAKKSKTKLIVIGLVAVIAVAGAAWFFLLRGGDAEAAAAEEAKPEPGAVLRMDPISINLADGHYLKLGIALQVVAEPSSAHGDPDGSKALDLAIDEFSGKPMAELASKEARAAAKEHLLHAVEEAYHHDIMDIYFTDFVMQ